MGPRSRGGYVKRNSDAILDCVHTSSTCATHGVLQCKFLHRIYWTKSRLSREYGNVDSIHDRCCQAAASLFHMFWTCPSLQSYRALIFRTISEVLQVPIDPSPVTAFFGVFPEALWGSLPSYKSDWVAFVTLLARPFILIDWKKVHPPSHTRWIRDVLYFLKLEKIRYTPSGSISKLYNAWQPFLSHVDNLALQPPLDAD